MKIKSIFKCLFTSTIVAFFLLICSLESKAQDQNIADVKEFKITDLKIADYLFTITKKKGKILLTGIEGTVWKELSFSLPKKTKQSIDHLGMTEEQK